ncbi:MAG TPA: hypothetical protein VFL55_24065 [Acetobacteraceae bacterium]|nr:hypothetical protein [Acetobacteraceae bacterium]
MLSPIERWRLRHAYPDAIGQWAVSTGKEAQALAFNAIAQDPLVLQRAARKQAVRLVTQAEDFARFVAEPLAAGSDAWQAATRLVQRSIEAWRGSRKSLESHELGPALAFAPAAAVHADDPWEVARRNFPCVDDATGRLATRLLHEFGEGLLSRARKPWDHVIALAALRHSARLLRDAGSAGATSAVEDVLTVQHYAATAELSPMLVAYTGPIRPAMQALSLLRDARTLRDAVAASAAGGPGRAAIWQRALEFHAFAIVALDHGMLLDLPMEEAYEIAAAAVRHADAALRNDGSVELPRLPAGQHPAPEVVRLHALACLPPDKQNEPPTSPSRID